MKNNIPKDLEKRIKEVEKNNVCPSCPPDYEVTQQEVEEDTETVNLDENTRDRG